MSVRDLLIKYICKITKIKNNRIVFDSFNGIGYSDSPKAICEVLRKSGEDLELYWICRDKAARMSLPKDVHAVPVTGKIKSIIKYRILASSKVWVGNCRRYENVKRKGQFYMQTWHGFALKKIEEDIQNKENTESPEKRKEYLDYKRAASTDSAQCDMLVSGSEFMSKIYQKSFFGFNGEVKNIGTPRDDIFFQKDKHSELHAKVCKAMGVPEDRKLVLYAPTFRDSGNSDIYKKLDFEMVRRKCKENFGGEWSVMVRLHPNKRELSKELAYLFDGDVILDATHYSDNQELLCAVELLITDYSSCMFDYALTGKRIALFATDIEAYEMERGFYYPLETLPFPIAQSNEELEKILTVLKPIEKIDKWDNFKLLMGFCENGDASRKCADIILDEIHSKHSEVNI